MRRDQVYELIDSERDYQDQKWGKGHDEQNNVCNYILYMQHHLGKAASLASTELNNKPALDELRKVVALGIACFEQLGLPKR